MNPWLITDTHFGHDKMIEACGRPPNFPDRIKEGWHRNVGVTHRIIHLGDIAFGHSRDMSVDSLPGRKLLVKGNHDKQTDSWYLDHGWDFVCENLTIKAFGYTIVFSHKPMERPTASPANWLNIHGHFHNTNWQHYEPHLIPIVTDRHLLYALEYDGYAPIQLRTFLKARHLI